MKFSLKSYIMNGLFVFLVGLATVPAAPILAGERIERDGYLSNKTAWSIEDPGQRSEFKNTLQLEVKVKIDDPYTYVKIIGRARREDKLEPQVEEDYDLREFYLAHNTERLSLKLGRQQVVWGKADGLRLLDIVTPLDLREFILEDYTKSRIPLWMFNGELFWEMNSLQVLVIPDIEQNDFAKQGGRFFIPLPLLTAIPFTLAEVDKPDESRIGDWEYGLKWAGRWGDATYTLNYLYTWTDTPVYFRRIGRDGRVEVTPQIKRQRLYGVSADLPVGPVVLRAEATYTPDRFLLVSTADGTGDFKAHKVFDSMIGLDWVVRRGFVSPQIFHEVVVDAGKDLLEDKHRTFLTLLLKRDLRQDKLKIQLFIAHEIYDGNRWIAPKISYDLGKGFELKLGADLFYGDPGSEFGRFDDQDRVYLETIWRF